MLAFDEKIGCYQIKQLLGQGGMAEVYKAWNCELHRYEALKMPLLAGQDHETMQRFLQEARTAARLQHPNIAAIHTVSDATASRPFFTMELVEGGDLADLIHHRERLSLEETWTILSQVASALDYAHSQGVIHRDIKPANILLAPQANGFVVKMVDFGISRAIESNGNTRLTKAGMFLGTPEYMSPEQAVSSDELDHHTDQYSLAIIAYEMLCGQPPFPADDDTSMISVVIKQARDLPPAPRDFVPSLPLSVNDAILKALSKKPDERFDSCAAFLEALRTPKSAPPTSAYICKQCGNGIPHGKAFCEFCEKLDISDDGKKDKRKIEEPKPPSFWDSSLLPKVLLAIAGIGVLIILIAVLLKPVPSRVAKQDPTPSRNEKSDPNKIDNPNPQPDKADSKTIIVKSKMLTDGSSYTGDFLNGQPNGHGLRYWPDGSHYSGYFINGKKTAYGILIKSDGIKVIGNWKNDEPYDVKVIHPQTLIPLKTKSKVVEQPKIMPVKKPISKTRGEQKNNKQPKGPPINNNPKKPQRSDYKTNNSDASPTVIHRPPPKPQEDVIKQVDINQPNGAHYTGRTKNGAFEGYGVYTSPDGTRFEGQFHNGSPINGEGKWTLPDKDK